MGRKRTAHPRSRKGEKTEGAGKKSKSRARAQETEPKAEQPAPKGARGGHKRIKESMTGKKSIEDPVTGKTLVFNLDDPREEAAYMRIVQKYATQPGAAKAGAKVKIDKLLDKRKLNRRNLWKKYQILVNYTDPKTGRQLSKQAVKDGMVNYIKNQTGEKISDKTCFNPSFSRISFATPTLFERISLCIG